MKVMVMAMAMVAPEKVTPKQVAPERKGGTIVGDGMGAILFPMRCVMNRSYLLVLLLIAGHNLRVTIVFVMIVLQITALLVMSFFRLGARNGQQCG